MLGLKIRKWLPSACRAEQLLIAGSKEEQPEVIHRAEGRIRRCSRNVSEFRGDLGRDEIQNYPVRCPPWTAKVTAALKNVHRKSLMFERFSYSCVNIFAEFSD